VDADERALHELAALATAVAARRPRGPRRPAGSAVDSSLPAEGYRGAVRAARELIAAGDCYEVNLAQRLSAPWRDDPTAFADALWRAAGHASHRAFVGLPGGAVVSASPERLLRIEGHRAVSEPIKGTARPGGAAELARSAKDRAEHVMIVDLVRNDLGRVAATGSVRVPRLMAPYRIGYADHLVSAVEAELAPGTSVADAVRAVFPGGSVTGAPKVRAMEVIRELEPVARGPAYGSVIALGRDGSLEASVAIRTAWLSGDEARYWCGGAVVWDSDPETERREAWAKAAPFLEAVGAPAHEG
jgi:para-aminobenzoate synthetase component 1